MFENFNVEKLKQKNIQEVGRYVMTRGVNIKEECRGNYVFDDDIDEDWLVNIGLDELDNLIDETDYEDYGEFDDIEFDDFVGELIKKTEHYLIVAYNSNWRGQTGYKFVNSIRDIFIRDYECSQYVMGGNKDNSILSLKEFHHDCPMGFECVVIALTDEQFENLENAKFDDIVSFGDEKRKEIKYI